MCVRGMMQETALERNNCYMENLAGRQISLHYTTDLASSPQVRCIGQTYLDLIFLFRNLFRHKQ
jgi:hypothetical protein